MPFSNKISITQYDCKDTVETIIKSLQESERRSVTRSECLTEVTDIDSLNFDGINMVGVDLYADHIPDTNLTSNIDNHNAHKFLKVDQEKIDEAKEKGEDIFGISRDAEVRDGHEKATGLIGEQCFAYLCKMARLNVKKLADYNCYAGDFKLIDDDGNEYIIELKTSSQDPYDMPVRARNDSKDLIYQMQHNAVLPDIKAMMVVDKDAYDDGWLVGFNWWLPTFEILTNANNTHEYTKYNSDGEDSTSVFFSIGYFDQINDFADFYDPDENIIIEH